MKRYGNILTEETVTEEFCIKAIRDASEHKIHRYSVAKILNNINYYSKALKELILNDAFYPSEYKIETRIEHGKERLLQKPKFWPDQCIHHALMNSIKSILIRRIDPYTVASFPRRGIYYAHTRLKSWIKNDIHGTKYCLKGDIKRCFDSIKPEIVMNCFAGFIKDKLFLSLISKIVYSTESLALGMYTSAWILNIVLKPLDEYLRSQPYVTHYLRYMDDFVVFGPNKKKLRKTISAIKNILEDMKLTLKSNYQVFPIDSRGLDIIGYRYYRNRTILRKRNLLGIIRESNRLCNTHYTLKDSFSYLSRIGQLKHCHSKTVYFKYVSKVNIIAMKTTIKEYFKDISLYHK